MGIFLAGPAAPLTSKVAVTSFNESNGEAVMFDHIFLSVSDIERSVAFYTALSPFSTTKRLDYVDLLVKDGYPAVKRPYADGRRWRPRFANCYMR
jgi:hypothetical protein